MSQHRFLSSMPRRVDRAPQVKRHVGPYYGYQLKRVFVALPVVPDEPDDLSLKERFISWWMGRVWPVALLIVVTVAVIVMAFVANI